MQATIDRQRKELAKQRQKLAGFEGCKTRIELSMVCTDHSTASEDESDNPEVESQDEEDMGYGARAGGGFTSMVSIQSLENLN
jgi:hypothetical protein